MPSSASTNRPAGPRLSLYERRRKVWGALLGLLVVDAILVFFTLRPSGLSLPQQQAELARLNIDLKGRRESLAHIEHVQATLADSSRQGDEFVNTKFLSAATGFSTIMEEVDKLAVANGVRKGPVAYGYQAIKDRPGLATVEINLALEGEYTKIVPFVNN